MLAIYPPNSDINLPETIKSSGILHFEHKGNDKSGHPCYHLWADQWGAHAAGIFVDLPVFELVRAGYDRDWEYRTYIGSSKSRAPEGYFKIKFRRVDYDE